VNAENTTDFIIVGDARCNQAILTKNAGSFILSDISGKANTNFILPSWQAYYSCNATCQWHLHTAINENRQGAKILR